MFKHIQDYFVATVNQDGRFQDLGFKGEKVWEIFGCENVLKGSNQNQGVLRPNESTWDSGESDIQE